ncbi:M81 family metallopeptidase [Hydrogenophaga sp. BPS33]|uniref:M81 family metallopeptidase n=1 Tax=Hydrogenophaga sp. BPS33 TaxID=2651974 RepID=UPI00131FEBF6|nr:M81 family metallopeptidase [Hydrogenophaga sp. BPS33]QHE83656.1 M81 family metallopeptidase [Hydrogenophaga sp. BPS33]
MPPHHIAFGGFSHESNSFAPSQDVGLDHFLARRDRPPLLVGDELFDGLAQGSFPTTGFLRAIGPDARLHPLAWASGGAGGLVSDEAFEHVSGALLARLPAPGELDAIYLELHGAMATPRFDDPEAELLRRVRQAVGATVPIVVTLDYHANLSPDFARLIDGAVVYRTYPHVDRLACGEIAARLVQRLAGRGRVRGVALVHLPFLIPLQAQSTLTEPSRDIAAQSLADAGDIVSRCYAAGFPLCDTPWCGPSVMVHATNQATADAACHALVDRLMAARASFAVRLWPCEEAVSHAMRRARGPGSGPVVLADVQDNPGAGASSATTGILASLLRQDATDAVLGILWDPAAAAAAHALGEGARLTGSLGGHADAIDQPALAGPFEVERLGNGRFTTTGQVAGGNPTDLGPMALLRLGGVRVVVSSVRMQAFDPAPFHHLGVDPARAAILVLKSTCHFRADFGAMAREILLVEAPGDAVADPMRYPYQRLRAGVALRP